MDPTHYNEFIDDAERRLRSLRSRILTGLQEGNPTIPHLGGELAHLRERAAGLQLLPLAAVLESVEFEAAQLYNPDRGLEEIEARVLLDLIAHTEAEVLKLRFDGEDDTSVGDFVESSFGMIQAEAIKPEPAAKADDADTEEEKQDEFEPDAEMLEIFSIEAEELLSGIEADLERLAASPSDRDALWEVRRHAHTFKGAAGIIGLKKPSKLAHRIEDLLDHLAENTIAPDGEVLELINAAAGCLRTMTTGDAGETTHELAADIYKRFDEAMARLADSAPAPAAASAAVLVTADDGHQSRRPIVRVSIGRLDNLVETVRDLVVSRSAVDRRITDLETHIESLGSAIRRLQAMNAKMENDFEASMLAAYVPSLIGRQRSYDRGHGGAFAYEPRGHEQFDVLEFDRYTDFHESSRELSDAIQECFSIGTSLEALKASLETVIEDQRRLIEETQDKVMQIRLIRFESLATRLQRAVRVTCDEERKLADVVLENDHIELDTDVLDSLVEPLMHLVRNAVVHGIEPPDTRRLLGKPEAGRITVRVENQETHIELRVSDDGRGIDFPALRTKARDCGHLAEGSIDEDLVSLLAIPGLTTAERLTMSAGRGVGMGIVKESIRARNGSVRVETSPQQGTTFVIRVPLALAVTQALLVRTGGCTAAIPFRAVKRILEVATADLAKGFAGTELAGLPVCRLADHFAGGGQAAAADTGGALIIQANDARYALIVDEVLRTEEIAVKPLAKPLENIAGLLGAAVLGNGEATPVLDVARLPKLQPAAHATAAASPADEPSFVLVVDDSPSVRHITSKALSAAGWNVVTARDGVDALEILKRRNLPQVVLTDVEMPRLDGYGLAAAIRENERLRGIPVVFVTSRSGEKHREKAAELGVTEYLTKPFVESELIETVERLAAVPVEVLI